MAIIGDELVKGLRDYQGPEYINIVIPENQTIIIIIIFILFMKNYNKQKFFSKSKSQAKKKKI